MNKQTTIALCLFGVIPRSIKYTYQSIKENIIDVLKTDNMIDVKVYGFNLNVGNAAVNGVILDQNDIKIVNYDYYDEYDQSLFDANEYALLNKTTKIQFRYDYSISQTHNAIRQMYSEYRVGLFLDKHKEIDIAIVCGPDFFIANKLDLKDLYNVQNEDNVIYTTCMNDADGYTNGFYLAKSSVLIKILKRYEMLHKYLPTDKDYEFILYKSFIDNSIIRKITNIVFFKIRANKDVFWPKNHNNLGEPELQMVLKKFNELKSK